MLYSFDHHHTETKQEQAPAVGPTDEQLMEAIQKRDQAALATLFRRHKGLLCTIVSRVLNNDCETEDAVQEIMLEVWRLAENYASEKGKALGWIVTLARRRAIDRLRRKQTYLRVKERFCEETVRANGPEQSLGADEEAEHLDRAQILKRVISTLPAPQQDALNLAFYHGMSQREIAAHTGIPLGTIKTRLELAMRKVRTGVLLMGGTAEWAPSHT